MRGQVVLLSMALVCGLIAWWLGAITITSVALAALALAFAAVALWRERSPGSH